MNLDMLIPGPTLDALVIKELGEDAPQDFHPSTDDADVMIVVDWWLNAGPHRSFELRTSANYEWIVLFVGRLEKKSGTEVSKTRAEAISKAFLKYMGSKAKP